MTALVRYEAARAALAEAKSVDEVRAIRDAADAMRAAARVARDKQMEIDAAEIRFRAERALGEMMSAQSVGSGLNKGGRPATKTGLQENPVLAPPTLAEAGIDKNLADRARKLAAVPQDQFDGMLGEWRERVSEETERVTTKLLKTGERIRNNEATRANVQPLPSEKYAVIYADPPWTFQVWSGEGKDRAAENHYPTLTQEQPRVLLRGDQGITRAAHQAARHRPAPRQ